jgi:transcriptional antiterminator/mannitol/fructose-specific phosphotransferase system IIA component (Ntr-type)
VDNRETKLLQSIVSEPGVTSADLLERLDITRRQLDYSLQKLNHQLADLNLPAIKRTRAGEILISPELVKYAAESGAQSPKDTVSDGLRYRDEVQRTLDIIFYIIVNGQYISLTHLYEFLNVGKTTVAQDLKTVATDVHRYGLELLYDRQNGYRIMGTELKLRRLLLDVTSRLLACDGGEDDIQALVIIKQADAKEVVERAEQVLQANYSDKSLRMLMASLQANVSRTLTFQRLDLDFSEKAIRESVEYSSLRSVIPENWYHTEGEFQWLVLIFLTANTWTRANTTLDESFSEAVEVMIARFEEITYSRVQHRAEFTNRLVSHLQPAFFRVKYGMPLIDNAFDVDNGEQTVLIDIVREVIKPIEKLARRKFPDNELRLLSYYFGLALDSETPGHFDQTIRCQQPELRAEIVSNTGVVQTHILYSLLEQTFPEVSLIGATSIRDFDPSKHHPNLVFTTVPLATSVKQFVVPITMNQIQRVNLRYRVLREMDVIAIDDQVDQLVQIVSKDATVINMDKLRHDLQKFLLNSKSSGQEPTSLPQLPDYLAVNHISCCQSVPDWQAAIAASASGLLKDGYITQQYIDRITAANSGKDAYSFLGTAMAIPHARSQKDVLKDGFGIVVLKEPVTFPNGMHISLVVTLALVSAGEHVKAVNQLAEIALDKRQINKLIQAKDHQAVYQLLVNND